MSQEIVDAVAAFLGTSAIPSEKTPTSQSICSRVEIIEAVAPPLFRAIREGRAPIIGELVGDSGLLPRYPSRSGLTKSVGDALGHGHGGAQCHRSRDAIRSCRENIALVLRKIPEGNREPVAIAAGFESLAALVAFAQTLPSVVR